ncbi:MAG TPA: hypothetical protein VFK37_03835 [Bacillales bacterium]|nr:hypothetical protein [Bacillales bacterium]
MQLQDALYNWLSIKKVAEARPDDRAAEETCDFFQEILEEDHHLENLNVSLQEDRYIVHYRIDGQDESKQFPKALVDALLNSIESEPKYDHQ